MRRITRLSGVLAAVGLAAGLTLAGTVTASASGCAGWSGGQPAGAGGLNAVAVVSECDVWAAGASEPDVHVLIEHWTGASWSVVTAPAPGGSSLISGMTAVSATDIWAVGEFRSGDGELHGLILHWDGSAWTQQFQYPGAILAAVTAVSASDAWAVGSAPAGPTGFNTDTVILHWDGSAWTRVPSPNPAGHAGGPFHNDLAGVTATSPSNAWAVGRFRDSNAAGPLILHWDGTSWTRPAIPAFIPGDLAGVAATSPSDAWAVGSGAQGTFIMHWDGTSWTQTPSPSPDASSVLNAVTASSPASAWAVGNQASILGGPNQSSHLLLHWNGTQWAVFPTPSNLTTGTNQLDGVAAGPAGTVWAVGQSSTPTGSTLFGAPLVGVIPAVAGDSPGAATAAIGAADLRAGGTASITSCSFSQQGTVLSTTPPAGTLQAPAWAVLLNVCAIPPQTVPDLTGDTLAQAAAPLAAVGMNIGLITSTPSADCIGIGHIQSQDPAAGTQAPVGTYVAVNVLQRDRNHPCL